MSIKINKEDRLGIYIEMTRQKYVASGLCVALWFVLLRRYGKKTAEMLDNTRAFYFPELYMFENENLIAFWWGRHPKEQQARLLALAFIIEMTK